MKRHPTARVSRKALHHGKVEAGTRILAEEAPIALVYNGTSHAVMMSTPADLEDFAIGFSLNEGIIDARDDLRELTISEGEVGIELRMWLDEAHAARLQQRHRYLAGPTGCGLCGIDLLQEATRPLPVVTNNVAFRAVDVIRAVADMQPEQGLNRETRAVHAAAFWQPGYGLRALREDVGRHNALDKLAGALNRANLNAHDGMIVLTSRVSVEMVQKAAMMRTPVIVAISAPTALALRTANDAGITIAAIVRDDGFEIFTHPHRISTEAPAHVA